MRVIGKILSAIIVGLLSVILFALDQVAKVYSLVAGVFFLLVGICVMLAIISQQWTALGILGIIFAIGLMMFLGIAESMAILERLRYKLVKFGQMG